MTDHETSPQDANSPLNHMWDALLVGDPGPFVAFFDSLMNSDFPFGAGGLLRDLADRIVSATQEFEDESERETFVEAAKQAIRVCVQHDDAELQSLLAEAREQ